MPIEKATLEARIVELQGQLEQAKANVNATAGAIQCCQQFLALLEKE